VSEPAKSANGLPPLSDPEIQEAEDNLVRCLEAYDQRGEQGLQEELERIHPNPELAKVGLRGIWTPLGHAVVSDQKPPRIGYEEFLKAHPDFEEE
jgi:hypothetical protein